MSREQRILTNWRFQPDPQDSGESYGYSQVDYDASRWRQVSVPCSLEAGHPDLEWYAGAGWYRCAFHVPEAWLGRRVVLRFEGVNYHAEVWVNGQLVARNEDGFLPFQTAIQAQVCYGHENILVVKADNVGRPGEVPGANVGWRPYGGILREVMLYTTPLCYIGEARVIAQPGPDGGGTFTFMAVVANEGKTAARVSLSTTVLDAAGCDIGQLTSAPTDISEGQERRLELAGSLESVTAWSPDRPVLYSARARLLDRGDTLDTLDTPFGFRQIETDGSTVLLNGEPIVLRGFNRHEDSPHTGMCTDLATVRRDLLDMKALGANFVRLCHYPHHPDELDLCDELGLLAMDEIPVYGSTGMAEDEAQWQAKIEAAHRQLDTLIRRDWNHPSLIFWSVSNETHEEEEFVIRSNEALIRHVRELDSTRLAVHVSDHWNPRIGRHSRFDEDDVICLNDYPWMGDPSYATEARMADMTQYWVDFLAELHGLYPDKPILIAEYGYTSFKAVYDNAAGEDVHAKVLQANFSGMAAPYVCGTTIWCYADHAWPVSLRSGAGRALTISPYGVVTRQRERKDAAYTMVKRLFSRRRDR